MTTRHDSQHTYSCFLSDCLLADCLGYLLALAFHLMSFYDLFSEYCVVSDAEQDEGVVASTSDADKQSMEQQNKKECLFCFRYIYIYIYIYVYYIYI